MSPRYAAESPSYAWSNVWKPSMENVDQIFHSPIGPDQMDWSAHYPAFVAPSTPEAPLQDQGGENRQEESTHENTSVPKPRSLVKNVEIADIGCGYGGLLFALAPRMPDTLILGLEIRTAITEFVDSKIRALRYQSLAAAAETTTSQPPSDPPSAPTTATAEQQPPPTTTTPPLPAPGHYQNIATHRTNTMKFLPNFLPRAALRALFLCFPDPHFKSRKHKARIVTATLCAEYAYALRPGGLACTVTDVEELAAWMRARFDAHPAFARVLTGTERVDPAATGHREWTRADDADDAASTTAQQRAEVDLYVHLMRTATEEGAKVDRVGGAKYVGVWRRLPDPPWPGEA